MRLAQQLCLSISVLATFFFASVTPEPSSFLLLGAGALGAAAMLQRKTGPVLS